MRPYCRSDCRRPALRSVSVDCSFATIFRFVTTSCMHAASERGMSARRISSSATFSGRITLR